MNRARVSYIYIFKVDRNQKCKLEYSYRMEQEELSINLSVVKSREQEELTAIKSVNLSVVKSMVQSDISKWSLLTSGGIDHGQKCIQMYNKMCIQMYNVESCQIIVKRLY